MVLFALVACTEPVPAPVHAPDPAPAAIDPGAASVAYTLAFDDSARHAIGVTASARCPESAVLDWWMAVWTPGSYVLREYARHVSEVTGPAGPVEKVAKNRWRVACAPGEPVGLSYEVHARTLSVQDSFVDRDMGVLNGASVFVLPEGAGSVDLTLQTPARWAHVQTALPPHPDGQVHRFRAPDVDTLLDAPILLGALDVRSFDVADVPHHVVTLGEAGPWDHAAVADEVRSVAAAVAGFWGSVPLREYRFLTVLSDGYGGLEHRDSTLMVIDRWHRAERPGRLKWLGLVSHEYFHTWNVKRMRPEGLGPFDYEHEVYTPSLWIAEGLTSYYDDLLLVRADLMEPDEYLQRLSENIADVQQRPGRLVQALGESSRDAWIKHYRRDENSKNTTVSYYTKGAVVGWLLDAEIRRATGDARSLDDVMRAMWSRHRHEPYTPSDFRGVASEVAGRDLSAFFDAHVDRAGELDFGGALQWWGLRWAPRTTRLARRAPWAWACAGRAVASGCARSGRARRRRPRGSTWATRSSRSGRSGSPSPTWRRASRRSAWDTKTSCWWPVAVG